MTAIVECVPNFSEGRDLEKIARISNLFRDREGVRLLDCQHDADHNRMVVTVIGAPDAVADAMLDAMGEAVACIDMNRHQGQHPRMGAVDVVPFVPVRDMTMEAAVALARKVAEAAAERFALPIFLYEKAASSPARENLAEVRRGQFEAMAAKLQQPEWQPDFGPAAPHPTAGVTAVGARAPLVAFNVNLGTADLTVADRIARQVRHLGGGLRYCKAMGVALAERGIVQVSMNMTDYSKTALYRVVELIRIEARRYGVPVVGSEIVGLVPMAALVDTAAYYLGLEGFDQAQVIESHLLE